MITKKMTAKQARDNFTDLLGVVYYGKQSVIVEKKGRPFAVVISPDEYLRYKKAAKERFFELVDEIQTSSSDLDANQVLKDVTKAVEEVRQEHHAKRK